MRALRNPIVTELTWANTNAAASAQLSISGLEVALHPLEVVGHLLRSGLVPLAAPGPASDVAAVDVDGPGESLPWVGHGVDRVVPEASPVRSSLAPEATIPAPARR